MAATALPKALTRADLVVVSDCHIRQPDDLRATTLVALIDSLSGDTCKVFLLLGDIFDFFLAGSHYFERRFAALGVALSALSQRGTRVIYVEGNHEFHLPRLSWSGIEFWTQKSHTLILAGRKIAISHGDVIYASPNYLRFRAALKSAPIHLIARTMPATFLNTYALGHAKVSRSQDKYRTVDHAALIATMTQWVDDADCDDGIFGHFHVPYGEPTPKRGGRIMSVESWDRPNILFLKDGSYYRTHITHSDAGVVTADSLEPVKPLIK